MTVLERITTEYVETEDRVRLSAVGGQGETLVLWLTRRLLDRLVPHLLAWLAPTQGSAATADLPPYHVLAVQGFAQEAARAALEPQSPVPAVDASGQWLIGAIDITPTPQALRLTFRGGEPPLEAQLLLEPQPLRQWLGILHDGYRRAEWPLSGWPDWMAEGTPTGTPALVH